MNPSRIPPVSSASLSAAGDRTRQRRLADLQQQLAQETLSQKEARVKATRQQALMLQIQQATAQMEQISPSGPPEDDSPPGRFSTYA